VPQRAEMTVEKHRKQRPAEEQQIQVQRAHAARAFCCFRYRAVLFRRTHGGIRFGRSASSALGDLIRYGLYGGARLERVNVAGTTPPRAGFMPGSASRSAVRS